VAAARFRPPACLFIFFCAACGPPPAPKGPPPPRFHDRARGISFDPPAPPYIPSETDSADSVAHFADPATRGGIHILAFAASGATDETAIRSRAAAYMRGLEGSVAGLQMLGQRAIERFGLHGMELEYEGGVEPRMRSIDWILYAPGQVYVIKVRAPAEKFAELAKPLLASRATLAITPR
jgi:hypothetical protein